MKTFFAAFIGVVAAGVLLIIGLSLLGRNPGWQVGTAEVMQLLRREDRTDANVQTQRNARRSLPQRHVGREADESQAQRQERLALLTATLRTRPIASLPAAETHLFQEAERTQVGAASNWRFIQLLEPVQIDEWTVLGRGDAVEFVRFERDNLVTICHEGAAYQVDPCQTDLRASVGQVCEE